MKKRTLMLITLILSGIAAAAIVLLARGISSGLGGNQSTSKFPVQIQEYMASNTLYPNENGVCADWVELYNASDADIDIGGFKLTDESRKARYTVPSGTVLPGHGYYVICCMRSGGSAYADFGISRTGGEELILLNRKNVLIDSVTTIALPENASAERDETGVFRISEHPSPGAAAAAGTEEPGADSEPALTAVPGPLAIGEVIPGNTLFPDASGTVADLVELINLSDAPIEIGGYALQDGIDGKRLELPAGMTIEAGGFCVIRCQRGGGEGLCADFALTRNGGELLLLYTDSGTLTDFLTTVPCGKNESLVRNGGTVQVSAFPSPGFPNTYEGYCACLAAYTASSPVRISEIMTSNSSIVFPDGSTPDWIELKNASDADVDLSGYGLSDSAASVRYLFPKGTVLPTGGYLVVHCDGNAGKAPDRAHFGLSASGGETVFLTRQDGTLSAAAVTVASAADVSLLYDGGVTPTVSDRPTPGFSNDEAGAAAYGALQPAVKTGLVLSEFMPVNRCTLASQNGSFADWAEIYNAGSDPVDLGGFCLSDRETDLKRFTLPAVTLAPGEYILVWFEKGSQGSDREIRAPFGLSGKGGCLILSSVTGVTVDRADYPSCEADRSFVRDGAMFVETDCPTPGFANTPEGFAAFLASRVPKKGLYISEAMPSNRSVARTGGEYYDWAELCNDSAEAVLLSDYCLTDDTDVPDKYTLPPITLESGEYFLVFCSGDASLTEKNTYHCPFKLNGGEDTLYLYGKDGRLIDYLHLYMVPPQGSIGRDSRESGLCVYKSPTPRRRNEGGEAVRQTSLTPTADVASGVYENTEGFSVTLSAPGRIYYTTDGSAPTVGSALYTGPIRIDGTSVVRAAALEEDKALSDVLTLAYTVNEGHGLPVAHLVLAPEDFNGDRGIYSNPEETWQKNGCIVYADANGTVTHDCGVRISGQHSRGRAQKSFKLVFSDAYGGRLRYDIFGETCEQKTFPQLLLRAGLDSKYGIFREPLIQKMALPYRSTTFVQDSVPCVVYINGAYFGIYQFMEALCEETLADRLGVTEDSITLYKGYLYPEHRDLEIYQLLQYVGKHDMTNPEDYAYIKAHIDFDSLIDWAIFQAFCDNTDLSGNVRYFKSSDTDGRWHFVFYDTECGFKTPASFEEVLRDGQTAVFLKALLKNGEFKDMFLKRLAFHCKNTFRQEQTLAILYAYDAVIRPETKRHFTRWGLQPITYVYNFNDIERLLKADRVQELQKSAQRYLRLTQAELDTYFGG